MPDKMIGYYKPISSEEYYNTPHLWDDKLATTELECVKCDTPFLVDLDTIRYTLRKGGRYEYRCTNCSKVMVLDIEKAGIDSVEVYHYIKTVRG